MWPLNVTMVLASVLIPIFDPYEGNACNINGCILRNVCTTLSE